MRALGLLLEPNSRFLVGLGGAGDNAENKMGKQNMNEPPRSERRYLCRFLTLSFYPPLQSACADCRPVRVVASLRLVPNVDFTSLFSMVAWQP